MKRKSFLINICYKNCLKGCDQQCMVVKRRMYSIVEKFFRYHFRPMRRFYGAYLFSKSANSILKILVVSSFLRDDFENRFLKNYLITQRKL